VYSLAYGRIAGHSSRSEWSVATAPPAFRWSPRAVGDEVAFLISRNRRHRRKAGGALPSRPIADDGRLIAVGEAVHDAGLPALFGEQGPARDRVPPSTVKP